MLTIGQRIRARREALGMSQEELARLIGYKSRSSINKIELDQYNLRQSKIKVISEALKTTPSYIMGWDTDTGLPPVFQPLKAVQYVPVIGEIACGTPVLAEQNIIGHTLLPEGVRANLALHCKGDSMIGAGISDGDTVFIREQPEVENGEIAAVMVDYEATLKRVYRTERSISLVPENPKYSPMIFMEDDMNKVQIVGKVIAVLKMVEK